eukprot:172197-Chlamydomonas_euryale.AAC.1
MVSPRRRLRDGARRARGLCRWRLVQAVVQLCAAKLPALACARVPRGAAAGAAGGVLRPAARPRRDGVAGMAKSVHVRA